MANQTRSKKAIINTMAGFADEIISLICGLILPRLILVAFGSKYNGITSSITQFISCIALLKSGIGGVTKAALYKPLAENDNDKINAIVSQTQKYMKKIALIFIVVALIIALIYPTFVNKEFDFWFTFSLILIISISTFSQYYFGFSYQMVLSADQKQCVTIFFNSLSTIINTVVSVMLIKAGFGIHIVKLGSSAVFVISPIVLMLYVKKRYKIKLDSDIKVDYITQRWDAFGHAVANFVNDNTDIMVLTIFSSLNEVSVYTVYHYVIISIRKIISNFITGFGAAFGNMYALNQIELMKENLKIYELIVFSLTSVIYAVTFVMITPFVMLYTKNVVDVNYYQPTFGVIITLAGAFSCFRIPYQTIVTSIGHYKQTRNGAFIEAFINIIISIIAVIKYGLVGVAIGTLLAAVFRTFQYAIYLSNNILKRSIFEFLNHLVLTLIIFITIFVLSKCFLSQITTAFEWVEHAVIITIIAITLTIIFDKIFYEKDLRKLINKLKRSYGKRNEKI